MANLVKTRIVTYNHGTQITLTEDVTTTTQELIGITDLRGISYVLIQNISDEDIYMELNDDAVVGESWIIPKNGGSKEFSAVGNFVPLATYNFIHDGVGSKKIKIMLGTKE